MSFLESMVNAITMPLRQIYRWLLLLTPGTNLFRSMSVPAKWTWVAAVFLLLNWFAALTHLYLHRRESTGILWVIYLIIPLILLIVIPCLVYFFVRVWLLKEDSPYPDIDAIWRDAMSKLQANGMSVEHTPIFLVLGMEDLTENQLLLNSARMTVGIQSPENGPAPISVFASHELIPPSSKLPYTDGIFVFLNRASCTSRQKAIAPTQVPGVSVRSETSDDSYTGTVDITNFRMAASSDGTGSNGLSDDVGGTVFVGDSSQVAAPPSTIRTAQALGSQEINDCQSRLKYICRLIREARQNQCPMNGILATLPIGTVESASQPLQQALQRDLSLLRTELKVRVPVLALVTGLEADEGFQMMIKNMPPDSVFGNRFGKGAELWMDASPERLRAIASNAAAAFEDQIYNLFRNEKALKRNNGPLYRLLVRVRSRVAESLENVIAGGFGFDPTSSPDLWRKQFLFGGCYFASLSVNQYHQAFVRDVLRKLIEDEGKIEWLPEALSLDRQSRFLSNLCVLVGMLAILAIITMLTFRFAWTGLG